MAKTKLSQEARRLVRGWIVSGLTNGRIRALLEEAGHPAIGDSGLAYYRQSRKVKEALEAVDIESLQVGLALRARRIRTLSELAEATHNKMMGIFPGHPDMPRVPCSKEDWVLMGRELRAYLRDISLLVDSLPEPTPMYRKTKESKAAIPAGIHPMLTDGFPLGMLNDALEKFLNGIEARERHGENTVIEE